MLEKSPKKEDKTKEAVEPVGRSHEAEVKAVVDEIVEDKIKEVIIDSAAKWQSASTIVGQYRVTRPDGSVDVFPLRGIPSSVYYQIMKDTKPMAAPEHEEVPKDTRGIPVQGMSVTKVIDEQDPAYLASVEEMGNKQMTLVIDAALPFDIPGESWQEQFAWLQDKLPGDVINLKNTIERLLFNLPERFGQFL
jgi:hypothetical protein